MAALALRVATEIQARVNAAIPYQARTWGPIMGESVDSARAAADVVNAILTQANLAAVIQSTIASTVTTANVTGPVALAALKTVSDPKRAKSIPVLNATSGLTITGLRSIPPGFPIETLPKQDAVSIGWLGALQTVQTTANSAAATVNAAVTQVVQGRTQPGTAQPGATTTVDTTRTTPPIVTVVIYRPRTV